MMKKSPEEKFKFRIYYPWKTLLLGTLLLFYALLTHSPVMQSLLHAPAEVFQVLYLQAGFVAFLVIALTDVRAFRRQQLKLKESMQQLWSNKRELQSKAQTSASHTDKLKSFIGDKLLEYIEYDEKFLHFKSIASEVRHNGVISFDKVQSALLYAKDHSLPDEQGTQATLYSEALVGMRYLWDLLDLSTTDNMALHIGNQITQCEEQVFEAELQGQSLEDLPVSPAFNPRQALIDSLTLHLGVGLSAENPADYNTEADQQNDLVMFDDEHFFRVNLQSCESLLGNANHFVLMLENLLRNAQFFAGKKQYKSPFPAVAINLSERQQYLDLAIYNRGPHIAAEQQGQIFQLGYSTRRVKEHNGKGLGLYFVQQIVQGFDGSIAVHNIENSEAEYHLRLEFADGDIHNLTLNQTLEDGLPLIAGAEEQEQKQWQMEVSKRLVSVEVHRQGDDNVSRLQVNNDAKNWFDPLCDDKPGWQITLTGRKQEKLSFIPLDIRGVEFQIRMPTLSGRLDGIPALDNGPDVDKLDEHFQLPDDF